MLITALLEPLAALDSNQLSIKVLLPQRGLAIFAWMLILTFSFDQTCLIFKLYDKAKHSESPDMRQTDDDI